MSNTAGVDRRTVLQTTGGVLTGSLLAGCSGGGGTGDNGGDGKDNAVDAVNFAFKPDSLTISKGDTVTWAFKARGHNVSAWPGMHPKISIPSGAEGFGTMSEGGDKFATVGKGETFEHTFETKGTFNYVCVPHATSQDMVGKIVVE